MIKVLIVEHDFRQRQRYSEELRQHGLQVVAVGRARQAREVLNLVPIDMVILDLAFPNGMAFLQRLAQRNHDTKIIIHTADSTLRHSLTR